LQILTRNNYYETQKAEISNSFSKAVVSQALNGQLSLREARRPIMPKTK